MLSHFSAEDPVTGAAFGTATSGANVPKQQTRSRMPPKRARSRSIGSGDMVGVGRPQDTFSESITAVEVVSSDDESLSSVTNGAINRAAPKSASTATATLITGEATFDQQDSVSDRSRSLSKDTTDESILPYDDVGSLRSEEGSVHNEKRDDRAGEYDTADAPSNHFTPITPDEHTFGVASDTTSAAAGVLPRSTDESNGMAGQSMSSGDSQLPSLTSSPSRSTPAASPVHAAKPKKERNKTPMRAAATKGQMSAGHVVEGATTLNRKKGRPTTPTRAATLTRGQMSSDSETERATKLNPPRGKKERPSSPIRAAVLTTGQMSPKDLTKRSTTPTPPKHKKEISTSPSHATILTAGEPSQKNRQAPTPTSPPKERPATPNRAAILTTGGNVERASTPNPTSSPRRKKERESQAEPASRQTELERPATPPAHAKTLTKGPMGANTTARSIGTGWVDDDDSNSFESFVGREESYVTDDVAFVGDVFSTSQDESSNASGAEQDIESGRRNGEIDDDVGRDSMAAPAAAIPVHRRNSGESDASKVERLAVAYEIYRLGETDEDPLDDIERLSRAYEVYSHRPEEKKEEETEDLRPRETDANSGSFYVVKEREEEVKHLYSKRELEKMEELHIENRLLKIFWYTMFFLAAGAAIGGVVASVVRN